MPSGYGPAEQVRESARRRKLEELARCAHDEEDRLNDPHFFIILSMVILDSLEGVVRGGGDGSYEITASARDAFRFFNGTIMASLGVGAFARTTEERDALLAELLYKYLLPEAISPILKRLRDQEFREPEKIYGVEDRRQEVPFEDDD